MTNTLAELLLGYVKLEGTVTRMDGSRCFWFTDRYGVQRKYATPRPDDDPIERVKTVIRILGVSIWMLALTYLEPPTWIIKGFKTKHGLHFL